MIRFSRAVAVLVALGSVSSTAHAQGQSRQPQRGFNLLALPDVAFVGMRPTSNFRFYVSNAGPMDVQQGMIGTSPATRRATSTAGFISQFNEVTLFAAAAPGDRARNSAIVPSLGNVKGVGAAVSYNYHVARPGISHWLPVDGSLGFEHSGARSTSSSDLSCLNHTAAGIPVNTTLMAASDCPQTWPFGVYGGRRPIPQASFEAAFNVNRSAFRFDFANVPVALQDTTRFLGDRFATYGVANDYSRERKQVFGNIIPGGVGEPSEEGYPLGLEWRFDAFTFNSTPGTVYWQATVTNRTRQLYGQPLDYDSLYAGVLTRHGRGVRGRAGFDIARGAAVFNENGRNSTCDNARAVPGSFSFGGYLGNCPSTSGFASGASAVVFLKSPLGDLRYKQFVDPTSKFYHPTSPVAGDTITYNIGRMCGDDCIQERFGRASTGFGVIAAREALALGGDQPSQLEPFQYWALFHPQNGAPYSGGGPRVDLANPRAGGGFNFFVPANWRYSSRPSSAPTTGNDTLFIDTCNPVINACVHHWRDTMPDRSINFTRNATWVGAGPFRLPADSSASLVIAIIAQVDSTTVEREINGAIALYQAFYVAPSPPPPPRVVSARVIGGSTRLASVRIILDNRAVGWQDPFLVQLSERYRTAPLTTVEGRLQRVNRLGPLNRTIADTLLTLASRNTQQILVYKSCDGGRNFTTSNSPNLCTRDVIRDTLGVDRGPAAYRTMNADSLQFLDNNVFAGQTYYYAFVPVSRGARLQLRDSISTTSQRVFDTLLVAPASSMPTVASAPNVAVVYVPASTQAGSDVARLRITDETGPSTLDRAPGASVDTTWNGLLVVPYDSISREEKFRLVVGDTVVVHEYTRLGTLDSTIVIVRRTAITGYTPTQTGTGARTVLNAVSQPKRVRLDTLRFVSTKQSRVPIQAPAGALITTTGAVTALRTTTTITGFVPAGSPFTGAVLTQPVGVAVIVSETENNQPILISNQLYSTGGTTLNAAVLRSPEYRDLNIDIINRPVVVNNTATNAGGAQVVEQFVVFPGQGRALTTGVNNRPIVLWQSTMTRMLGTSFGEYVVTWAGPEFGPAAPFDLTRGFAVLEDNFRTSLNNRVVAQRTDTSAATLAAINTTLGLSGAAALTQDSLVVVTLPFTIVDKSNGNRPVTVAMRRADKSLTTLLGSASDTTRINVPSAHWIPGEPLILLETTSVAVDSGGRVGRTSSGAPLMKDSLTVLASRAVLNCTAVATPSCNPIIGRGGTGHVDWQPNMELHVRYAVPYTSDRDIRFTVTPSITGTRITGVSRAQLDSVKVVPNPYILYSNYEQSTTNEQRIMFTHLPPQGTIRIYTVTGQFAQQITWTAADLQGNGDLYYNLLTREGTLLASGLYIFTVTATGPSTQKRSQVGRFIVIR